MTLRGCCGRLIAVHLADDSEHGRCREEEREHDCKRTSHHVGTSIQGAYSPIRRSLKALPMTDTELKVMAALAIIGLSSRPNHG